MMKITPSTITKGLFFRLGCLIAFPTLLFSEGTSQSGPPVLKKGEKQLFVDDLMISATEGVTRVAHPAKKLEHPVLQAEMPWEKKIRGGVADNRVNIYGTVLRDEKTGTFRMWYAQANGVLYATSNDGIRWERPILNIVGKTNQTNLKLHSPSIIYDTFESDPQKKYKAIGCLSKGLDEARLQKLKEKFELVDWYRDPTHRFYYAAYSADGLNWTYYPEPVLLGCDTITLSQDPKTGEYLAFHKRLHDPRVKKGHRQVFLSVSKDMKKWSEPQPVMVTDDIDDQSARLLPGGTHSEFYNLSAFPYAGQWLGCVTHFRRIEAPGSDTSAPVAPQNEMKSAADGFIDVQLVHSRDGRTWSRCSDRTPIIPLGPHAYDAGTILGLCNSPVIVGDEMWMYYTAMTTTHAGALPEKELSIARAVWRLDGMASFQAKGRTGFIKTVEFVPEGKNLLVNADIGKGRLMVEVLDTNGQVIAGYEKESSSIQNQDSTKLEIKWKDAKDMPTGAPIRLRFYLENGDLYSYEII